MHKNQKELVERLYGKQVASCLNDSSGAQTCMDAVLTPGVGESEIGDKSFTGYLDRRAVVFDSTKTNPSASLV